MYVCSGYVYALWEDFGVGGTQSMNKWRALAVETEVFAKSEDPFSLWTHPAVPLSLSLSAETKTLADQATLSHNTSAKAPRDGHGVETRGMMEMGEREKGGIAFALREVCLSWEMNLLRVLRLLISSIIARWPFLKIYLRRLFIFRAISLTKQEMPQAHLQQRQCAIGWSAYSISSG